MLIVVLCTACGKEAEVPENSATKAPVETVEDVLEETPPVDREQLSAPEEIPAPTTNEELFDYIIEKLLYSRHRPIANAINTFAKHRFISMQSGVNIKLTLPITDGIGEEGLRGNRYRRMCIRKHCNKPVQKNLKLLQRHLLIGQFATQLFGQRIHSGV